MFYCRAVTALSEQYHIRLWNQGADADAVFYRRYRLVVTAVHEGDLAPKAAEFIRVENAGIDVVLLVAREHLAEVAGIAVGTEQLHPVVEEFVGYQRMIVD